MNTKTCITVLNDHGYYAWKWIVEYLLNPWAYWDTANKACKSYKPFVTSQDLHSSGLRYACKCLVSNEQTQIASNCFYAVGLSFKIGNNEFGEEDGNYWNLT